MQLPQNLLVPLLLCTTLIDANSSRNAASYATTHAFQRDASVAKDDDTTFASSKVDNKNCLGHGRFRGRSRFEHNDIIPIQGKGRDVGLETRLLQLGRSIHSIRGGGGVVERKAAFSTQQEAANCDTNDEDDDDDTIINPQKYYQASKIKRGTRTTGAGARKHGPNRSIFSYTTGADSIVGADDASSRLTTAALAGHIKNSSSQTSSTKSHKKSKKGKPRLDTNNPMIGRLWAKRSKGGALILKFPTKWCIWPTRRS